MIFTYLFPKRSTDIYEVAFCCKTYFNTNNWHVFGEKTFGLYGVSRASFESSIELYIAGISA